MFDPTQDQRFRQALRTSGGDAKLGGSERLRRQEIILNEAAAQDRRHSGLGQSDKHDRPLIVVVTKFDQWSSLFPIDDPSPPWRRGGPMSSSAALDVERVDRRSQQLRSVLIQYCPEIVAAAEGLAREVTYIAVGALGPRVEFDPETGAVGIRPMNIRPHWVAVPFLYSLTKVLPGLIPRIKRKGPRF